MIANDCIARYLADVEHQNARRIRDHARTGATSVRQRAARYLSAELAFNKQAAAAAADALKQINLTSAVASRWRANLRVSLQP
jgi:hypothetical protein